MPKPKRTGAHGHDHAPCLADAIQRAQAAFEARGTRLTPLRRQVFEEIAGSHDAVGAYDVLDRLIRKTGERMAPISVYRAIDALLEVGVVHRLESRNAFYACHRPHEAARPHLALHCEACGAVTEVDASDVHAAVGDAVRATGFRAARTVVEVSGTCRPCKPG
jgi:Fur family zinc uptake transcriptional regulator